MAQRVVESTMETLRQGLQVKDYFQEKGLRGDERITGI